MLGFLSFVEQSIPNTGFTFDSFSRGILGLVTILIVAYLFSNKWSGYMGANLLTQFTPGYENDDDTLYVERKSNFFAPAYLTIPLGVEYKPNKYFFVSQRQESL